MATLIRESIKLDPLLLRSPCCRRAMSRIAFLDKEGDAYLVRYNCSACQALYKAGDFKMSRPFSLVEATTRRRQFLKATIRERLLPELE